MRIAEEAIYADVRRAADRIEDGLCFRDCFRYVGRKPLL